MMKKRIWNYPEPIQAHTQEELDEFHPLLRQLLFRRGIETSEAATEFLSKDISQSPDPFRLKGMEDASRILLQAIDQKKPIAVYGDYDADGVTGTALLTEVLQSLGAEVIPYLPNRFEEGYGLNRSAISSLWQQGARLLISVDCGIRANVEVKHAKALGFQTVVTDHHHPGEEVPAADAIVNPRQPGGTYSFVDLAGVGLAYKLAQAIHQALNMQPPKQLDLVAIGTVADLAPLLGENRILVSAGLKSLNRGERLGLAELVKISGLKGAISATDIAFRLAPRINASGRMLSAEDSFHLLLSRDPVEAKNLAAKLDQHNRRRQAETSRVVDRAEDQLLKDPEDGFMLFALGREFHEGVVGLAASRLLEKYYRPVLVASQQDDIIKGSARSIPEFHITEALETCSDLLLEFGGHAAAAGFQLRQGDLAKFYDRMEDYAQRKLKGQWPDPKLDVDLLLQPGELNESLLEFQDVLEPFGQGNPAPVFAMEGVTVVEARQVGTKGDHLKMTIHDDHRYFDAIGFRLGHEAAGLSEMVDLAFHFEWNEFRGRRSPQLNIIDLKNTERV